MRATARGVLSRLGLIDLYIRLGERRRVKGREKPPALDERGVPIAPLELITRVNAHADWRKFVKSGLADAQTLDRFAAEGGVPFAEARNILDLGCGCGRVIRNLSAMTKAALYGSDFNSSLIKWCAEHLEGDYRVNQLNPPLDYQAGHFDVVYLLSVFTHLRIETQRDWLKELARIVRPGGVALVTFHDEIHAGMPDEDTVKAELSAQGHYIYNDMAEGSNLIATFQTTEMTKALFAKEFDIVRIVSSKECPFGQAVGILKAKT